ncbi:LysR family transcriptional regulator [Halalkalibacterium ligniniphilum]|uniref:LysR family transcriptional regulator n=1 Tax=Halalkalibacterium ligniniphilum TaxID=1134413 RepID=UPI000361C75B|nr:LysR family transcriptional regulator [Halalkalibacterium ligniniphilum]
MLGHLLIFVTVVEQRHFSKAAKLLNLSQPNVSLHIRNLENELGTVLLHRSPKHVNVTEEGEILYIRAKKILSLYEEAKQEINDRKSIVQGTLKIGASFTIGEYLLPRILADYAKKYPNVKVEVVVGNTKEVCEDIRMNQLDIGIVEGEVSDEDVNITPFMEDEMIMIAPPSHPLSQIQMVMPEMLQDQVWILREDGSGTRAYSDQLIRDLKLRVKHLFIFSSSQGIKEAVSAGLGIAMISRWTVLKELEAKELKRLNINNRTFKRDFAIIQGKQGARSKAHQLFLKKLEHSVTMFTF